MTTTGHARRTRGPLVRAARTAVQPWLLLVAALEAGFAWALGLGWGIALGAGVGIIVGFAGHAAVLGGRTPAESPLPRLSPGTVQARLYAALDGYLTDLRSLREARQLPSEVTTSAIEALVAAGGARDVAYRVALAVDGLDTALARTSHTARQTGSPTVAASLTRMRERRHRLLERLESSVNEVAEAYTKLLELSVTVDTLGVAGGRSEVQAVNASLDGLLTSFAALDTADTDDMW